MNTALHTAVQSGSVEELRRVLQNEGGATDLLDAEDPVTHETPLHLAAKLGHKDVAGLLLEAGADAGRKLGVYEDRRVLPIDLPYFKLDALAISTSCGHTSVVETILAATGPLSLDTYGEYGFSPLYVDN